MIDTSKKCFQNKYCQECIAKNIAKYGRFDCNCNGITVEEDVKFAVSQGLSEEEARWIYDSRYFFEKVYGSKPRFYQEPILLCTSKNLASRQCRQSGKTLAIMFKIMHFLHVNSGETVLVVGPNEKVIKKIYDEYIWRDCINKSPELKDSVRSKTQKPYYQVEFCNDSKVMAMIANESARGQTCSWLYADEAAIIPTEMLNSIIMTMASTGDDATLIETSTPKGRGNMFYQACKEDSTFNEFHVPISIIDEMKGQIDRFIRLLGETGFIQECEAEFPDTSGGPFNYKGIDLAKSTYDYPDCVYSEGTIYIGGVDWNGPGIGSYFTVIGFNPATFDVNVVERQVVSSANWNSLVAKQTLIELNRKWKCSHWMVDYGYSTSIVEEIRSYSMQITNQVGHKHPDAKLKHIIDPIEFGSLITMEDPFTKEEMKKTTRSFMVGQIARLFEPYNGEVSFHYPKADEDITRSLENYKLLGITTRGYEQYGFAKGDGIEDHLQDSINLAIYGIIKYYSELFKRIVYKSVTLNSKEALLNSVVRPDIIDLRGRNITLITDDSKEHIKDDERKMLDPIERIESMQSRTFGRSGVNSRKVDAGFLGRMHSRGNIVKRSIGR